jgi:hypothetical protein
MSEGDDYGTPVHYTAVERGTAVYDSEGVAVGSVRRVQDNFNEHILDGFEISDNDGAVRFVDAPEVARTFERAVTLSITAAELPELTAPVASGLPLPEVKAGGFLSRLFGKR